MYKATAQIKDYTTSESVDATKFGGWLAVNTGTAEVSVNGYPLQPGDGLDFTHLHPEVVWGSPIQLQITNPGGRVRLTMLRYSNR